MSLAGRSPQKRRFEPGGYRARLESLGSRTPSSLPKRFPWPLLRVFLLGAAAIIACVVALARAYRPKPPLVVPVPAATEIPAPELVP